MELKIKIVIIIAIGFCTCNSNSENFKDNEGIQDKPYNYKAIKEWKKFYFNPSPLGVYDFAVDSTGNYIPKINDLLLSFASKDREDTILFPNCFYLDSIVKIKNESRDSQIDLDQEYLSSKVIQFDQVLSYEYHSWYQYGHMRNWYDYINIFLPALEVITLDSVINDTLAFDKMLNSYAAKNKVQIFDSYMKYYSDDGGYSALRDNEFHTSKDYDINKLDCKTNHHFPGHFSEDGVVFLIDLLDKNYEKPSPSLLSIKDVYPTSTDYPNIIVLPYSIFIKYVDKNNKYYSSFINQVNK